MTAGDFLRQLERIGDALVASQPVEPGPFEILVEIVVPIALGLGSILVGVGAIWVARSSQRQVATMERDRVSREERLVRRRHGELLKAWLSDAFMTATEEGGDLTGDYQAQLGRLQREARSDDAKNFDRLGYALFGLFIDRKRVGRLPLVKSADETRSLDTLGLIFTGADIIDKWVEDPELRVDRLDWSLEYKRVMRRPSQRGD